LGSNGPDRDDGGQTKGDSETTIHRQCSYAGL
jgi:hypothetical protein